MDENLLRIFRLELQEQCEQALEAARQLTSAPQSTTAAWSEIQSIISSAANAGKLLWGSQGPEKEAERKPLRDSVEVSDDSVLRSRDVRNAFEHFDERLERWYRQTKSKSLGIRNVGNTGGGIDHFGLFNPETGEVIFWKWSISLTEILGEMENILVKLMLQ